MRDILFRIPIPFTQGALPLHGYGLMAMLGFLAAVYVARWRARRVGISPDNVMDVALFALLGGIVGSRLFYVVQYDMRRPDWTFLDVFKIWEGGLVFYGGFLGATALALIVMRARKERVLPMLDALAPSLALGHAFGRIGCLLRGCCYGRHLPGEPWYGIHFPRGSLPYDPGARFPIPDGAAVFPTQIVSALDKLVIFALLSLYFRHRKGEGEVFGLYLVLYSVHRFIIEFFRGDVRAPGTLSAAQWISLAAFFAGLCLWTWARTRGGAEAQASAKGPLTKKGDAR